jgi:hypothetical protein
MQDLTPYTLMQDLTPYTFKHFLFDWFEMS